MSNFLARSDDFSFNMSIPKKNTIIGARCLTFWRDAMIFITSLICWQRRAGGGRQLAVRGAAGRRDKLAEGADTGRGTEEQASPKRAGAQICDGHKVRHKVVGLRKRF